CGLVELAVVTEELGRSMVPGPFLPTVLTAAVLREAGRTAELAGLADGATLAGVALDPGTLRVGRGSAGTTLSGRSGFVLGGHTADVLLVAAEDAGNRAWVLLHRDRVDVEDLPSHDVVRGNSQFEVDRLALGADDVLRIDPQRVTDLAAALFAAEASGIADWCVRTAAEYAAVRRQFGRPIGQFQGVKHRAARMLALAEQARVCAWDAARALTPGGAEADEASLAAAVAGATAPEAAFAVSKDCIQILGGIGYTWEHDAHLYLRRAQSLRILLGSTASWRRRVTDLTRGGTRRVLGIDLPPEAERIRDEVRGELAPAATLDGAERTTYLAEKGYTAPHLPAPWGKGADAITQLVIAEELRAASLRPHDMIIGNWVVPTLIENGSPEQLERFVPPSLRGDIVWCQLF
ncbi:MAG: acyl-CoA dehydrogenase, partial [Rhodococcus sp. (in: high G+C Gram-positive bacteria)]|nr:acyl-CoA dehydrogenase [Rhodococcus sp. (in: high G+C Gram-positive bacteria)]MDX5455508.1 acyl-CoA dehydrogenase [Rhodococcus sp. (in: high G+C Gram-positive bacteria)]